MTTTNLQTFRIHQWEPSWPYYKCAWRTRSKHPANDDFRSWQSEPGRRDQGVVSPISVGSHSTEEAAWQIEQCGDRRGQLAAPQFSPQIRELPDRIDGPAQAVYLVKFNILLVSFRWLVVPSSYLALLLLLHSALRLPHLRRLRFRFGEEQFDTSGTLI